jgi:diguanylate cyclase (GGDEF)-like protein
MIDIDAFKKYNDHYGHPAGDRCLQAVAQAIQQAVHRPADLAARYGGEEFAVLLPETDSCGARFLAMHLVQAVAALRLPHAGSPVAEHVTLSIGVSAFEDAACATSGHAGLGHPPVASLLAAADQALYAAKEAGRNQARFLSLQHLGMPERAVELCCDAAGVAGVAPGAAAIELAQA